MQINDPEDIASGVGYVVSTANSSPKTESFLILICCFLPRGYVGKPKKPNANTDIATWVGFPSLPNAIAKLMADKAVPIKHIL